MTTRREAKEKAAALVAGVWDQLEVQSADAELDALVAKAYPDGGWAAYRECIARFGNPPDQIANFERARVILQPKQLEFAAWARRMDDTPH